MKEINSLQLDCDSLLAEAVRQTGLDNFGDPNFRPAFAVLVKAMNNEAKLNEAGRSTQVQRLLNILKNRLRLEAWIQRHPEILEEIVLAPAIIVGLARTGTTMLHRILANDNRFFAPLWFEVRNPAPYMDWEPNVADQRLIEATAEVDALLEANPEIAAIHPMDPKGADEEIMLLEHSFYSYVPNAYMNVPSYTQFVGSNDNLPAYHYLYRLLQCLQWQKKQRGENAQRWLLKAPHHLHFMGELLTVFPDAQIIATHRDPALSVPSVTSMMYNLWITCSDTVDKIAVANEWSNLFAEGMRNTLVIRQQRNEQFYDVWFEDSVKQPFAVIEALYQFLGMQLTPEAHLAMQEHREANKREDRPTHEYTLEEYGLSEQGIRDQYGEYFNQFIKPRLDHA